jgi:hypothetical protein
VPLLAALAALAGQSAAFAQIAGWLQVDDARVRERLGFVPEDLPIAA